MSKYYFNKTVDLSFEEAIAKVTDELKKTGMIKDSPEFTEFHEICN